MLDPSSWTEADLYRLIKNDVQEDVHLDYKASRAISREDKFRSDVSTDVSAFANADGGIIIYGIVEDGHHPKEVDEGVDTVQFNREWLEQVITSNIQPRIENLKIYPIPLLSKGADRAAYVVEVPQSTSRAPHQSRDKRYYKRYNFRSDAMEDYEITDVMRRATTPNLFIRFQLSEGDSTRILYQPPNEASEAIILSASIGNHSTVPAQFAAIRIYFSEWLTPVFYGGLKYGGRATINSAAFKFYTTEWCTPPRLPIFQEAMLLITEQPLKLTIDGALIRLGNNMDHLVGYEIRAPGFSIQKFVTMIQNGRRLSLCHSGFLDLPKN